MNDPLIFISAGDPSGDIAAGRLALALKKGSPGVMFCGLGGDKLNQAGQEQFAVGRDLAVLGFWEVARRFRYFQKLMSRCVSEIERRRPKVIVLVDYPGFNLRLAARVKHLRIPIVYYIAPQVWAWGRKRVHQIRELVDQLLVILPFEERFFADHGVKSTFVGHYLLEDIQASYQSSPVPGKMQIALLPGSRPQEIERMIQPMIGAARLHRRRHGGTAVIAGVRGAFDYDTLCAQSKSAGISVSYGNSREVIYNSDLVITASGTATLETGIIGRPMVIVYKTGEITYQIARRLIELDKIGLVNLVLGEKVVPELIHHQATPPGMAAELDRYIADAKYRENVTRKLMTVPSILGGIGASERTAEAIGRYL
jgi:lipid-A-disaccharide synthase